MDTSSSSGPVERGLPITILIADDHQLIRDGLTLILEKNSRMQVLEAVSDGRQAVEAYEKLKPDVTLLDLQMPIMGGAEAIEKIRLLDPDARLMVLTAFDGDEDIYRAMRAGARAFLVKDTPTAELIQAVEAVFRGERYVSPQMGAKLAERMEANALSSREVAVLQLMAEGKSNKAIAHALGITEGTVRTHVTNLMAKLGVRTRTEAAMVAMQRGLLRR